MKRFGWLILVAAVWLATPASAATHLWLADGQTVTADDTLRFDGRAFRWSDQTIPRDRVRELTFAQPGAMAESDWRYDAARYDGLFAKGRELADRYPNRPAVVLEDLGVFRLEDDGTNRYVYHFTALILKEQARHLARVSLGHSPQRDRIVTLHGVVVHPDGSYRLAADADRQTTQPYRGSVFFDNYLVTALTLPDVRVGDIVEYWYETHERLPPHPDFFFPFFMFQADVAMARTRLEIRVPAGRELRVETEHLTPEQARPATFDEPSGGRVYAWEFTDSPPFDLEPSMPAIAELVPSLRATVLADWQPIFDHLAEFYRTRMVATDRVKAVAQEVVGDAANVEDKIARLYRFVQRRIRYISIKTDVATGWTGHAADVTLTNGYGDCTDKAILLATMLGVIGVESHPIVLRTFGGRRDIYSIPNLAGNHAINVLFVGDRRIFLDATAETFRFPHFRPDDHGRPYFDSLGRTVGIIERPPPEISGQRETWSLVFDPDGAVRGTLLRQPTGFMEAMERQSLEGMDPRRRRKNLEQMVLRLGAGARLADYQDENLDDLDQPLRFRMTFTANNLAKTIGAVRVIDLPGLPDRLTAIDKETRRTDLMFPVLAAGESSYEVTLPKRWQVIDLPKPLRIDTPELFFDGRYEPTPDGFRLTYQMVLRAAEVPVGRYAGFRRDVIEAETFFARRAFVREVGQ
jgi:hypothetical protein